VGGALRVVSWRVAIPLGYYTFWQNVDSGTFPGDQDRFDGSYPQLQQIACAC
jgi:hypothetical protein